jgi:hypothetical protein
MCVPRRVDVQQPVVLEEGVYLVDGGVRLGDQLREQLAVGSRVARQ